ncbi:hypothetical protein YSY43_07570 [Paenibacillus sp. YSY-4.3]
MTEEMNMHPELEDFHVEAMFENHTHELLEFTFKVEGEEFKGHFHGDEIIWFNPHPKQTMDESRVERIESAIHSLIKHHGVSKEIQDFEKIKPLFEDTAHERKQFSLQMQGDEYKGFVHRGEVHWFHPQPHQKLEDGAIRVLESEIHEKVQQEIDKGIQH